MINIALLKSKRAIYIKRATEIVKNAEEVVFRFQDNKTDQVPEEIRGEVVACVNARIQRFGEYRKEG